MTGMAMRIDDARNDELAATIDDFLVRVPWFQILGMSNVDNPVAEDSNGTIFDHTPAGIDRDDGSVKQQQSVHVLLPETLSTSRILLSIHAIYVNNIVDNPVEHDDCEIE